MAAGADGGAIYALSVSLSVEATAFALNSASRGGGLAADCEAQVCVGQLPRDTCATQLTNLSGSLFASNHALLDGGAMYVSNHVLDVGTAGSSFTGNDAARGAVLFADPSATVTVDGVDEQEATNLAIGPAIGAGNVPSEYGVGATSSPVEARWLAPPVMLAQAMAGSNVCAGTTGCLVTLLDSFGNTVTTPTVVEIVSQTPGAAVDGPQYLLVAEGVSAPIATLGVRLTGSSLAMVAPVVDLTFGFRLLGAANVTDLVTVSAARCDPGWGAVGDAASGWVCAACQPGSFSASASWEACEACGDGTTTIDAGSVSCDWCTAGYGWDEAAAACVECSDGFYSPDASLETPCLGCADTTGDGATECESPLATAAASTPWWIWLLIAVGVVALVACVAAVAWKSSRRKVISHYYIGARRWVG